MEPVRLVLELEAGDPIRGSLRIADGPQREFAGLLQLVAALDQLRVDPASAAEPQPHGT